MKVVSKSVNITMTSYPLVQDIHVFTVHLIHYLKYLVTLMLRKNIGWTCDNHKSKRSYHLLIYIFGICHFFQKNMLACLDVRSIGTLAKFHLFAFTFERETWSKQVTRPNRRRDNEVGLNLLRKYAEAIFRI